MISFLPSIALLLIGLAVSAAALREGRPTRVVLMESAAHAGGMGAGVLSIATFASLFFGWPRVGRWFVVLLLAISLVVLLRRRSAQRPNPPARSHRGSFWVLAVLVWVTAGLALALAGDWHIEAPGGGWDAMAIWNRNARTLYRASGDWPALLSRPSLGHPEYPLLQPAAISAQWTLAGSEWGEIPRNLALIFLGSLGLLSYVSAARFVPPRVALVAAAVVLATPHVSEIARRQNADVPLAYLLLGASTGLASLFHPQASRRLPPWMPGFFLGLLPWQKSEGKLLALVLSVAFVAVLVASDRLRGRRLSVVRGVLAGASLPVAAVLAFTWGWAPPDPLFRDPSVFFDHLMDFQRWDGAATGFLQEWNPRARWDRWGVFWPVLGLSLLLGARRLASTRCPVALFLTTASLGSLLCYFVVYVATPANQAWHMESSLHRLLLHLVPTFVCTLCVLMWPVRPAEEPVVSEDPAAARPRRGADFEPS